MIDWSNLMLTDYLMLCVLAVVGFATFLLLVNTILLWKAIKQAREE